jgi:hypothetical protein
MKDKKRHPISLCHYSVHISFRSLSFVFFQFLVYCQLFNEHISKEKKEKKKKEEYFRYVCITYIQEKKKYFENFFHLSFSSSQFSFFPLLLNFKPPSRFLIDLTKIDLHDNWSRSVHQHLHVVERRRRKKTPSYSIRFCYIHLNLIYHNNSTMMPTIDTEHESMLIYFTYLSLSQ